MAVPNTRRNDNTKTRSRTRDADKHVIVRSITHVWIRCDPLHDVLEEVVSKGLTSGLHFAAAVLKDGGRQVSKLQQDYNGFEYRVALHTV